MEVAQRVGVSRQKEQNVQRFWGKRKYDKFSNLMKLFACEGVFVGQRGQRGECLERSWGGGTGQNTRALSSSLAILNFILMARGNI